jgi:hypothetical protein
VENVMRGGNYQIFPTEIYRLKTSTITMPKKGWGRVLGKRRADEK